MTEHNEKGEEMSVIVASAGVEFLQATKEIQQKGIKKALKKLNNAETKKRMKGSERRNCKSGKTRVENEVKGDRSVNGESPS